MLTTLIVVICASAAMDNCQAFAVHQWDDEYAQQACLSSVEPTLDALRRQGVTNVGAYCEESKE